jgi:urease accessory protein
MSDLPPARRLRRAGDWTGAHDLVVLDYDARFLRRRRLVTVHDDGFLVDLPETVSLSHGDAFELDDGRLIEVIAAEEDVAVVTGDLPRLAWHIGNRHTPCQIERDRLLIRRDHVLEAMLAGLGATLTPASEPFTPEGGAYGHGRTMGHAHGPGGGHSHSHDHDHDHHHHHAHTHDDHAHPHTHDR